ncbi:MAG: serine hydrolase [Patescibacteria group bacterium]
MKKLVIVLVIVGIVAAGAIVTQIKPTQINFGTPSPANVTPTPDLRDKEKEKEIEGLVREAEGTYGVYVYRIKTGETYGINYESEFEAASMFKLLPLIGALRKVENGEWKLNQKFVIQSSDIATGSGPLQFMDPGTEVTLEKILTELGMKSDNTAWRMLNRLIGMDKMQEIIDGLGMKDSNYKELLTTPYDIGFLWTHIYVEEIGWRYLTDSIYEDRITLGIPEGTKLIHKVGTDVGVWSDSGIVDNEFILVVMTKGAPRSEAEKLVPELTKIVWQNELLNHD